MSKYIGTPVVSLVTDTVDVTGDITTTDATPEVIIVNDTSEDTDGGREGKVTFKGQQSGGEETTLAQIQASHDGTSDDEKGDLIFKTNDGSDGASPTEAMRITSQQRVGIGDVDPVTELHLSGDLTLSNSSNAPYIDFTEHGDTADSKARIAMDQVSATEGQLIFSTETSGTLGEAMRIKETAAHGRGLGIGTTAPLRQLHISNTSANSEIAFTAGTSGVSSILFGDGLTGTDIYRGYVQYNHSDDAMLFASSSSERMRINSTGYLIQKKALVATQSTTQTTGFYNSGNGAALYAANAYSSCGDHLEIGNDATAGWASIYLHREWGTGEDDRMMQFNVNQATYGSILTTTSGTSFNTSSDYRMKENVEDLTNGITRVKQLQPKRFNFINDETNTLRDGFMAHEAQAVVPEAVKGTHNEVDDDGNPVMQQIDQAKLVPLLTAALQEAIAKIETLETKVAALEGE